MVELLTKEKSQRLINIKGKIKGVGIKQDWDFVLKEKGTNGLKKLEDKMGKLGYSLKYKDIKSGKFYPLGIDTISLLAMKELFGFDEKEFIKMGMSYLELSMVFKVFAKYLLSPKRIAEQASRIWNSYYTVGALKVVEVDEEKKNMTLRIEDFDIDSLYCWIYKGNFIKILQVVTKGKVNCEERKCTFRGDQFHEFFLTWEQ